MGTCKTHKHTHFNYPLILAYHMTKDLGVQGLVKFENWNNACTLNAAVVLPANFHFAYPL